MRSHFGEGSRFATRIRCVISKCMHTRVQHLLIGAQKEINKRINLHGRKKSQIINLCSVTSRETLLLVLPRFVSYTFENSVDIDPSFFHDRLRAPTDWSCRGVAFPQIGLIRDAISRDTRFNFVTWFRANRYIDDNTWLCRHRLYFLLRNTQTK